MLNYIKDAIRTESPNYYTVPDEGLALVMETTIGSCGHLDVVKKQLFYNKYPSLAEEGEPTNPTRRQQRLIHAFLGIASEAGELLQALYEHLFEGEELDVQNLREELGDLFWYQALACDELKTTFEELQSENIIKLRTRFPDKFEEELAINKDTVNEQHEVGLLRGSYLSA